VSDLVSQQKRRARHTYRDVARVGAAVAAVIAAGSAGVVTAFANSIISTTPTPSVGVVGKTPLSDTAQVSSNSTRHVVFSLWAPNTCGTEGATPVFTDVEAITSPEPTTSTITSTSYVAQQTGVYAWTVELIVNANGSIENGPTACADQPVTINKKAIQLSTIPSDPVTASGATSIMDYALLTRGFNPTGTVTFLLYGPGNPNCVSGEDASHGWLQRWVVPVSGDGTAHVPAPGYTTMMQGTYNWVVNYSGDGNNMPAHGACGSESVVVSKASPTVATAASAGGPVGTSIHDSAQLSGAVNPTGTVTFFLYAPSNQTCTNGESAGWVQKVVVPLGADGAASSAGTPYTTTDVGVYNWVATYGGDANNLSATSRCGDEPVSIGKDSTSVTTVPSAGGVVGTAIHDSAKVAGTFSPTGTVTFALYGPSDTTCKGNAIFTSTAAIDATGNAISGSFTLTTNAGTYNWVATYSGDAQNAGSRAACGVEPVVLTAAGGVQGITTPGTGVAQGLTQVGIGLLIGGLALALGGQLLRVTRRQW
jgi:hypothetical protein